MRSPDLKKSCFSVMRLTSGGIQMLWALVQWLSLERIACPTHLILLKLTWAAASLFFDYWRRAELRLPCLTCVRRVAPRITPSIGRSVKPTSHSAYITSKFQYRENRGVGEVVWESAVLIFLTTSSSSYYLTKPLASFCLTPEQGRSLCSLHDLGIHGWSIRIYSFRWA